MNPGSTRPVIASTLRAFLPFSRNDYWEVTEMKQRLRSR
jgi:hypothetical protein